VSRSLFGDLEETFGKYVKNLWYEWARKALRVSTGANKADWRQGGSISDRILAHTAPKTRELLYRPAECNTVLELVLHLEFVSSCELGGNGGCSVKFFNTGQYKKEILNTRSIGLTLSA
jgi:hypothetical protein